MNPDSPEEEEDESYVHTDMDLFQHLFFIINVCFGLHKFFMSVFSVYCGQGIFFVILMSICAAQLTLNLF